MQIEFYVGVDVSKPTLDVFRYIVNSKTIRVDMPLSSTGSEPVRNSLSILF